MSTLRLKLHQLDLFARSNELQCLEHQWLLDVNVNGTWQKHRLAFAFHFVVDAQTRIAVHFEQNGLQVVLQQNVKAQNLYAISEKLKLERLLRG